MRNLRNILVAAISGGLAPAVVLIACSGTDPILGLRQPRPPSDTGAPDRQDTGVSEAGEAGDAKTEGGEAGDATATDTGADSGIVDTGIDTGTDAASD